MRRLYEEAAVGEQPRRALVAIELAKHPVRIRLIVDEPTRERIQDCQATERSPDPCAVIFRADFEGVAGCCFPEVRDTIADSIQRFRVCL